MKKNLYLTSLLCGFLSMGITSCDNPAEPQFDDDQYQSVLYLKDTRIVDVDFYNVGEDVTFTTMIGKGGTVPSIARTASLQAFTAEELADYNELNATQYELLPNDCYEFSTEYTLEKGVNSREVPISFKAKVGQLDKSIQYVLPLKLSSTQYHVNENKNTLLLLPNVITPKVSLTAIGEQPMPELSIHKEKPVTFTTTVQLNISNPGWKFSVNYETDREILQSLAKQFNADKEESYSLLPSENYELLASDFAEAQNYSSLDLNVSSNGLKIGKYVLPIVIKAITGVNIDHSADVCYATVTVTDILNITFEDLYANSAESRNADLVAKIIDGSLTSGWQSEWSLPAGETPLCDPKYGVYIDIKNITNISDIMNLSVWISTTHNNAKHIQFYAGTSEDNLTLVHENENCYPNVADSKLYQTGEIKVGKISMIRIACIKSQSNSDLRKITASSIGQNVSISEVKVYGH